MLRIKKQLENSEESSVHTPAPDSLPIDVDSHPFIHMRYVINKSAEKIKQNSNVEKLKQKYKLTRSVRKKV